MTQLWRVGVLLAGLAFVASSAHAEDSQKAKELFRQGSVFFDLGQYDRAIEVWQRGYEEKQDPSFLYNLAQAYRLSGDARKAILFYKSFLRNAPKATNRAETANRAEIEEKIAALQKQISEGGEAPAAATGGTAAPVHASGAPATPGSGSATPGVDAYPSTAPASATAMEAQARPVTGGAPTNPGTVAETEVVISSPGSVSPAPASDRSLDLGLALGGNFWMSGVNGSADPSFSFALSAGYTFPANPGGRVRFRLGALLAYTFLNDVGSKVSFISGLVDPTVRIRISPERLFLNADVGMGFVAVAGLQQNSALLVHDQTLAVSGTQSAFEVRPGLAVEYRLRPAWALVAGSALAYTPKRTYFYQSLVRLELHLGFVVRL